METLRASNAEWLGYLYIIIVMLAGTMIVMWLGDQISVKGIGNGISMIIFAGIVCSLPNQFAHAFTTYISTTAGSPENLVIAGVFKFILYVLAYIVIIAFVTFVELMARASFLPIKINSAGVIPVIFASSLMMAPSVIAAFVDNNSTDAAWLKIFSTSEMYDMGSWSMPWGLLIYIVLTVAFTFFYANLQIDPQQMAENFQKNGSYIPGVKPGIETERYIRRVLNRVTAIGALALVIIASLPSILTLSGVFGGDNSLVLGGTGMIIVVGVCLELNNQIDGLLAGKSFDEVVASGGH